MADPPYTQMDLTPITIIQQGLIEEGPRPWTIIPATGVYNQLPILNNDLGLELWKRPDRSFV